MHNQGWIQDFGIGAQVELRGREDRGAEGRVGDAEGVEFGERVF